MRHTTKTGDEIVRIGYRPAHPYALDIEIFSMRSLKRRVPATELRKPHRIEFHQLICITRGTCAHVMDFHPIACKPGSVLIFQPSQTEQFDVTSDWDGWLVLFRPEFLFAPPVGAGTSTSAELNLIGTLAGLPQQLDLAPSEFRLFRGSLKQMYEDSSLDVPAPEVHALLRYQLCTLLMRLCIASRQQERSRSAPPLELERFRRLQALVERSFREWHQVVAYAKALGCTDTTLNRATMGIAGVTAKVFISARIALEARRLLVHTSLPVATIGDSLGFDDPSNFVKFFRREAGCTPLQFRKSHQSK